MGFPDICGHGGCSGGGAQSRMHLGRTVVVVCARSALHFTTEIALRGRPPEVARSAAPPVNALNDLNEIVGTRSLISSASNPFQVMPRFRQ